ncbi:PAS domain-containing protein [Caenimonas soli]|uniref:PAS domain-containing protein n=1 Tax=Caenimonas soli TaxID=2735555 RepID=UPI001554C72D|nr:PAS domain-containing protein [Caenimonas soli]NPC58574.1 PAS domain-containing protein [Caenimonas soli]
MQRSLSLQGRLAMLVVAAILPLAALSVWFAVSATQEATSDAQSQLKFSASLVAAHQDRMVESAQQLLAAVATMPGLRGADVQRCAGYFEGLRTLYPVYSNIGILDLQGRTICHANQRSGSFAAGDRSYVQRALSERRLVMGEAVVGRSSGRLAIPFARPIMEGDEVVAVAFAALDLGRAADALARLDLPQGASVVVSDRHGKVLMEHPKKAAQTLPANLASTVAEDGSGEFRDAAGHARIFGSASSHQVSGEGFVAVVAMDRAQVTYVSSVKLRNELLVLAVTLLAGVAAAWWVGGRAIVRPANQILGAVRRLEQGLLDARVPLQAGPPRGEFARIGAAFNLMAESLQLRQVDLQTELGRSRSAYAALDLVLNSMQEGLLAVTEAGQFLMFNEAAARLFPLATPAPPQQWAQHFGFYQADGITPYANEDLPLVRAALGESGRQQLLFVRNALVPQGRLLQCSWQPIRGEGGLSGGLVVFTDVTELQRLQAEQAAQFAQLQETQRKLIEAQRIGRVGNWELDLRSGRVWWSDEVYGLFGVTREQFEPTLNGFAQWVHPDDRGLLKPARDAALRDGEVVNMEYRVVKPDGAIAWFQEIAEARRNEQGEPIWFGGVVQDITARKKNEQALLHSERELHDYTLMLQRAAEAAQAITSHPALEETLQEVADQARRVIGTRQALVSLTGRTSADPAMRRASGEPGDGNAGRQLIVPLASRSGQNIGQLELSGKEHGDFTQRDEYVALELAQLASIAIDNARLFTQIRELNAGLETRIAARTAELTRQEQLYRTLAEQAPEVIWNSDSAGRLTFLNHAWYELVGGTPEDWIGTSAMAAIHPDDRAAVAANWNRSCETTSTLTGVRRVRAKDGSYHTMSYKAAPVLVDGKVAFWVGIDADITEFKAIERALRSSNQELEAFSYSVSHDLRAPLGAIGGFSRALELKLEGHPDDRARHYLARIQAGVGKMEQLIESLLALSKVVRAPLNYGAVDLSAMMREVVEGLQMQHPEREVSVRVQDGMVAQGDARLLRIVLENLVGNAWKFTSRSQAAQVEVGKLEDSNVFFVRDNGVGFDMAYAGKLFGAFQRLHTEAEFPGTGIGLATVRRIVARHQGRVWAESLLGQGTTFFFVLSESAPPPWLAGDAPA